MCCYDHRKPLRFFFLFLNKKVTKIRSLFSEKQTPRSQGGGEWNIHGENEFITILRNQTVIGQHKLYGNNRVATEYANLCYLKRFLEIIVLAFLPAKANPTKSTKRRKVVEEQLGVITFQHRQNLFTNHRSSLYLLGEL